MSPSTRSAGFGEKDPKRTKSEPSMAVFICFAATEDTNALLIIFGEVSKNDVNESGIVNKASFLRYAHDILLYEMQSAGQSTKFDLIKV
jgi:hypothetical protein